MFAAWLHLLQSLQPDRIVQDERGMIVRRGRWQERAQERKRSGKMCGNIFKWQRDV